MKKNYYIVGILALFILITTLVYNKFAKNDNDLNKITVAEVTHSVFYTPFYVSIENGYFKDEGIDLNLILTSGADKVASAVLSKDANIGLSGLEATLYVYQNKAKDYLVSFSSLTKRDGQFLLGDCSLKESFSLYDLKGKSVLAGRAGGMPSMVFMYALYKNGIDKDEVIIDNSVDFASLSSAYISKQGDFVNLFEPNATSLEQKGYGCVLSSLGKLSGEVPYTVFHARKSYIDENKETLKKFVKAIKRGMEFVEKNTSMDIAKVIQNQFPDTSLNDLDIIINRYKENDSWYKNTFIKEEAYNNLLDLMEYNDALSERYSFSDLVDNSFNE